MSTWTPLWLVFSSFVLVAVPWGCHLTGGDGGSTSSGGGPTASGGSGGGPTASGGSGGTLTASAGGGGTVTTSTTDTGSTSTTGSTSITDTGSTSGAGGAPPDVDAGPCTATLLAPWPSPLDTLYMIDISNSMSPMWDQLVGPLAAFFKDPKGKGNAGLLLFPNAHGCIWTEYAQLTVPFGPMPANGSAIAGAIQSACSAGSTPLWGALKGGLAAAALHQDANPTHRVMVKLVTDTDPTSCAIQDIPTIAALADAAFVQKGVRTSASDPTISAAGGGSSTWPEEGCFLGLPQKSPSLDPAKLNLEYAPAGATPVTVPSVPGAGQCGPGGGWYYDPDSVWQARLVLCPATCATAGGEEVSVYRIAVGCPTEH